MAAAGTSPALNLREKLAELAGLKQRVSPDLVRCDFTNLVTNGGFDTDTDWTKGTGWTIGSGVATKAAGTAAGLDQSIDLALGKAVRVSIGLTVSAGTFTPQLIGGTTVSGTARTTTGTYAETLRSNAAASSLRILANSAGAGTLDNVSAWLCDPSDDAPWLRLPYGYKVGQRGMIVRDGVILHPSDYTEITDSGQTFIKPIVAPGVSTEFSIWAGA